MAAVIRMKRHIDEAPLNAFVLNCKRRKTDAALDSTAIENKEETSTILKFAGTITENENTSAHISRLTKEEARELVTKSRIPNLTDKNRQDLRENSQSSRFKIVNCTRTIDTETDASDANGATTATSPKLTIVDVVKDKSSSSTTDLLAANASTGGDSVAATSSADKFVYDLYFSETNDVYYPDNIEDLSVAQYDELLYTTHRDDGYKNSDGESSDDSNDENNWRNDYPDEDEYESSVGDEDMRRAVEDFDLGGERELSSSDYDEDDEVNQYGSNVISNQFPGHKFCSYKQAVELYGRAYAKKRISYLRDLAADKILDGDDDEDDENEDEDDAEISVKLDSVHMDY